MKKAVLFGFILMMLLSLPVQAAVKPLTYVVHGNEAMRGTFQEILADFTKETGIPVEIIPVGSQREKWEKIIILTAGGISPDVVGGVSTEFGEHAATGLLRPLDDLIKRDNVNMNQIVPVFLEALQYQGKQYLLPYGSSALPMYYNVDHLLEAGLAAPPEKWYTADWTYDKFVQYARKLTKRDGNGQVTRWGISGMYWDSWITLPYPWGGDWVSSDLTQFTGDQPEAIAALQSLQDLIVTEGVMKNAYPQSAFQDGSASMAGTGTWALQNLLQGNQNWNFMPWFRVNEPASAAVFPIGYGVLSGSTNQENAWKLVKYLTWNADVNLRYALAAGAIPSLRVNLPQWERSIRQSADVNTGVLIEQVGNYGAVINIRKTSGFTSINSIMGAACADVIAGRKSAAAAMQEVAGRINALLQ